MLPDQPLGRLAGELEADSLREVGRPIQKLPIGGGLVRHQHGLGHVHVGVLTAVRVHAIPSICRDLVDVQPVFRPVESALQQVPDPVHVFLGRGAGLVGAGQREQHETMAVAELGPVIHRSRAVLADDVRRVPTIRLAVHVLQEAHAMLRARNAPGCELRHFIAEGHRSERVGVCPAGGVVEVAVVWVQHVALSSELLEVSSVLVVEVSCQVELHGLGQVGLQEDPVGEVHGRDLERRAADSPSARGAAHCGACWLPLGGEQWACCRAPEATAGDHSCRQRCRHPTYGKYLR